MKQALFLLCLTLLIDPAHVRRVIDGDTFTLYHVGVLSEEKVRLLHVDTPERGQPGFATATEFTADWLMLGSFTLDTCRRDSFGRLLATATRNGKGLSEALLEAGLGKK